MGIRLENVSKIYPAKADGAGAIRALDGVTIVSDGTTVRADLDTAGDEPLMLADGLPGVSVLVGVSVGVSVGVFVGVLLGVLVAVFVGVGVAFSWMNTQSDGSELGCCEGYEHTSSSLADDAPTSASTSNSRPSPWRPSTSIASTRGC